MTRKMHFPNFVFLPKPTWLRSPSFKSPSKVNGDIFGGSMARSRMWPVAFSPWLFEAVQEYFFPSSLVTS